MKKKLQLQHDIRESKPYEAKIVEDIIYSYWEDNDAFQPESFEEITGKKSLGTFCEILPPPNANASLHLGHASGYSIQDLIGRYNRMKQKEVLLLPGKDHAGIQTEVVFEKELAKKGIRKRELGRENFYKACYEFSMENSQIARTQEKKLGLSADYSRELFTLDPRIQKTVYETFIKMYKEKYLYRGKRIINWCVRCQTALADIDTEAKEEKGKLYFIVYGPLVVATTRPETKFADTALAVNPKDERYIKYIGKTIEVESVEGTYHLPVIGDEFVDKEFGTGVLKVTPGHSADDFKIAATHNLPSITVIDTRGKMTQNTGKYAGMKILEAREAIVHDLEEAHQIVKIEDIVHNIKVCERCKSVIEPLISYQWFIKLDELKERAIQTLLKQELHIHPKRQEMNMIRWLEIPEDWCVSRQLWWGYQIPAWYCGGKKEEVDAQGNVTEVYGKNTKGCGEIIVSQTPPLSCPKCGETNLEQDTDVLDTWFSSGQWPAATLKAREGDFEKFFPSQVMETGRDIIFFWIARMIMLSLYTHDAVPFQDVYLHGIVLDKEGKKQSKSKGNGVNPMEMIEKYGADALRLSFIVGNAPDKDYRLYEEKIKGFRNFINKIWNASRFILLQTELIPEEKRTYTSPDNFSPNIREAVQEIITMHTSHIQSVNKHVQAFQFGRAGEEVFNYFWHQFCDIDLEFLKKKIGEEPENAGIYVSLLMHILTTELQLMHPFIPFITEYLWHIIPEFHFYTPEHESIMFTSYPS